LLPSSMLAVLLLSCTATLVPADVNLAELSRIAPSLSAMVKRAALEPQALAEELRASPIAQLAPMFLPKPTFLPKPRLGGVRNSTLPMVVAHGMGDSCFNPGMGSITHAIGQQLNVYSVCVPTAGNWATDTIGGFLKNMDASVDYFAKRVRSDPKLAGGFNAFGLSQGNNVIRGYITKYNDPPVHTFMSVCGINAGVAAFPQCSPTTPGVGSICEVLTEVLGDLAYNPLVQGILFQANYFRDTSKLHTSEYLANSQLARWNGESSADMAAYKANYAKTSKFVWIEGTEDTVVWPREGEQWGALAPYPKTTVLPYKQTAWYQNDTFGLKAADGAGKNFFESFKGEHIRFTEADLMHWLAKYF